MTLPILLNGKAVSHVRLSVPGVGPWFADVDGYDDDTTVSGRVSLTIGNATLSGTVAPRHVGTFGGGRRLRIIAGGGGWANAIGRRGYHNDAGVKASNVAADAAAECGETIGNVDAPSPGIDYLRPSGEASRVLDRLARDTQWWVGFDGKTYVGKRATSTAAAADYELLNYDPRTRIATLAIDDLTKVAIGSIISSNLSAPQTIVALDYEITPDAIRAYAWCDTAGRRDAITDALEGIARHVSSQSLGGVYQYRVVGMSGTQRVDLQSAEPNKALPDAIAVSYYTGVPGTSTTLTKGSLVAVAFFGGDPARPVIVGFGGPDTPGAVAQSVTLGGEIGPPVARQGDAVDVLLPPMIFSGTIGGSPASGVLTAPTGRTSGIITGGSAKVKVAT